jgi:hypothetical protein
MTEETASFRELSLDDAPNIAAAISELAKLGLRPLFPEHEFAEVALRKAEEYEGVGIPDSPEPWLWLAFALFGSEQVFANAVHYQDHCFDVAGDGEYAEIVASIMALAGDEWPSATISTASFVGQGRNGPTQRMMVTIEGQGGCAPFELMVDKDFDWSVVTHLNERLPARATGRFAAFFDGNATIVYLRPDQLDRLGRLFGHDFVSEVAPLPERVPSPPNLQAESRLPVLPLVFGVLMGLLSASQLIAMILRGPPFTIPGRDLTPISFADAPVEFTFGVVVYAVGTAFFLSTFSYLIFRKWRARMRLRNGTP